MCVGLFITISLPWRYNVRYSSFVIGWWLRWWRIHGIHERSPIWHCIKWDKIWCWEMGVGMRGSECLGWCSEIWDLQPVFLSEVGTEIIDLRLFRMWGWCRDSFLVKASGIQRVWEWNNAIKKSVDFSMRMILESSDLPKP
jgi:hypothetical protein